MNPAPLPAGDADGVRPAIPSPFLVETLATWRARVARAGLPCRDLALHGPLPEHELPFSAALPPALQAHWQGLQGLHAASAQPASVKVWRDGSGPQAELLLVVPVQLPDGLPGVLGLRLPGGVPESLAEQMLLATGWLQLALAAEGMARSRNALRLLDLLGHVASQERARAAAQEWINRTAAWAREVAPAEAGTFGLMLFRVRDGRPVWWVASDTAWAETASPAVLAAREIAAQAVLELQELRSPEGCAIPVLDQGQAVAVLVLRSTGRGAWSGPVIETLRAALALGEPLLRRWQAAERPLHEHALASARDLASRLAGPGFLAWKVGAAAASIALAGLLFWPVPDRVTASAVIEGRQRHVVAAPFDGFLAQVTVRPGATVTRGQALARLDDRDLLLEQSRRSSELDQASGRLRQAMANREAAATAVAMAEVQEAQAQLALIVARLGRTALTAPVDGLVVAGDWVQQIGTPVEIGKELFEIVPAGDFRVVLHVPDREVARVRTGQTGALRLSAEPQSAFAFKVTTVTATATVQEGVNGFRVEADWAGRAPSLSPGMQGVGKIEVGTASALAVWTRSSLDWLRLKLWAWWW